MDIINTQLGPHKLYHIFNRGINGATIFFEDTNYDYFLRQFAKYVEPYVETLAYCLMKNHFHLLIKVKTEIELKDIIDKHKEKSKSWHVSNGFSSFFQSYTRAINKVFHRTGPLFESPFKRIEVSNDAYFTSLIAYIHRNPRKHGIMNHFQDYKYSSYHIYLQERELSDAKAEVIKWFGGRDQFIQFHEVGSLLNLDNNLLLE